MALAGISHLRSVSVKNSLIMGLVIAGKYLIEFGIDLIAVHLSRFLGHADAAEGHKCSL